MKNWNVVCSKCGVEFNLKDAPWCEMHVERTKLCPNGHCICHKVTELNAFQFRSSTAEERKEGFHFMLKEKYGGIKRRD